MCEKILIVSDDCARAALVAHDLTQRQLKVVVSGVEDLARQSITAGAVDMVICDIYAAATSITALCGELHRQFARPVLVLGSASDERFILDLYQTGVAEYITKPIGLPLLVAKVTAWLRRTAVAMASRPKVQNDFQQDAVARMVTTPMGDNLRLSKLEYRLFDILHHNRGRVLPTALLVDRIWGQFEAGDSRLKHVVSRLRRKIEPDPSAPTYIETVDREGYRFRHLG